MVRVNLRPYFDSLVHCNVPIPHVINLEFHEPLNGEDSGLRDSHRAAILNARRLCSYGGVVRAGLHCCYNDPIQPFFRVNLIAGSKDKKRFSCSVLMRKIDVYLVAYTYGRNNANEEIWYQFKDEDVDFQFQVGWVEISYGGSRISPPSDLISALGLYETICFFHNGGNVAAIAGHIKILMWVVAEPTRFEHILDCLSELFSDYEHSGLPRTLEDWILAKKWRYFCYKMIDGELKSTAWTIGPTERGANVQSMGRLRRH